MLLKHLLGLLHPDSGRVVLAGREVSGMSHPELRQLWRRIGVLFQEVAVFGAMTVFDNVAFPLRKVERCPPEEVRRRVGKALEIVGLAETADALPSQISGGQRKRVALARAVVQEPDYLFYDEPVSGLDPETADLINDLINDMSERLGETSVVVTHDIHSVLVVADRVGFLHEGRLRFVGSVERMRSSPDPVLREFIGAKAYRV